MLLHLSVLNLDSVHTPFDYLGSDNQILRLNCQHPCFSFTPMRHQNVAMIISISNISGCGVTLVFISHTVWYNNLMDSLLHLNEVFTPITTAVCTVCDIRFLDYTWGTPKYCHDYLYIKHCRIWCDFEYTVHTRSNSLINLLLNLYAVFTPITTGLCIWPMI